MEGNRGAERGWDWLAHAERKELHAVAWTLALRLLSAQGEGVGPKQSLSPQEVILTQHRAFYRHAHSFRGQELGLRDS